MKRGKFSLSHTRLLSGKQGQLLPIMCKEVLPGDTWQQTTSALIRLSPLLAPVMHPVNVRIHHWYVPTRLIWEDFEDFITGGADGNDATVAPTITVNTGSGYAVGSLADHLGLPTGVDDFTHSALPFRAYAKIFNEWYRDQDLVAELTVSEASGNDTTTSTALKNIAWEKDYFTSARPWPQKGDDVTLPLGTTAPVIYNDNSTNIMLARNAVSNALSGAADLTIDGSGNLINGASGIAIDPNSRLLADLSDASAATVNELRLAMALQRYKEARARYGSRYTEYLRYLGVRSSDARLQRPEYLGGGKQTIQFSEVLQTGGITDETETPVGEMYGHGIGAMRSNRYRRFFEEHGYVITLMSVRPKTMYTQGLHKMWTRSTKEQYWQRELQHIGQQEVLNRELKVDHATPTGTFGYQDRYDEYRRAESSVAGEFKTTALNYWHMARIFSSDPALNSTFVTADPTTRIHADTSSDNLYIMANHSIQARRLLAQTGTSHIF